MTTARTRPPGTEVPGVAADNPVGALTDRPAPDKRRWAALIIMTVAIFMDMLDGSIVNVALPTIQQTLGLSYGSLQWITAGYLLAFALLLITGGRLGDIYGRRRMFLFGVAGFTLASLLCGLAVDPATLIGGRLLQGAMAGMMVPQVLSIIHVTFPDEEKGAVYAINGFVGGLAATLAPLIGGFLVAANIFGLGWRPLFLINVPIGIVGFVLGMKYIPESRSEQKLKLDLVGVVLSAAGLLLLLLPLTFGHQLGWPAWSIGSIALSVVVLAGFVVHERRKQRNGGSPLMALDLFAARSFSASLGLILACFAFTGMFMLAVYLYLQIGLGWTPLHTGIALLAFAVGAFVSSTASVVVLVPKFGRVVVQGGALVMALGVVTFLMVNATTGTNPGNWGLAPALFLIGLGFGAAATPVSLFGLSDVPMKDAGSASGIINTTLQLGFALGIVAAGLAFFAPLSTSATDAADRYLPQLQQELVAAGVPANDVDSIVPAVRSCVIAALAESNPTETPGECSYAPSVQQDPQVAEAVGRYTSTVRSQTFSDALQVTLYTGLGFLLVSFLVSGLLPRRLPVADRG